MPAHFKLIKEKRIFMNTEVEFSAWTDFERDHVYELFGKAYQQFHFVVDRFSRFKSDSELSKVNASSGSATKVSKEFLRLVQFALEMAKKTNGAFDPTVIDFLQTYGYDAKYNFDRLKNRPFIREEIKSLLKKRPSWKEIKLNKFLRTITLHPNQRIDLGSIGKGYAIDLAFDILKPLDNYIINAGGDIRAAGTDKTNTPWLVDIKSPKSGSLGTLQLNNQSVCCSGSWARKVQFFHHLINPKTGIPENEFEAVFVIAPTALEADAWTTALYALGKTARKFIEKYGVQALLYTKRHEVESYNFPIASTKYQTTKTK